MEEKIVVKEYEPEYFTSSRGTNYRIINFFGELKVYRRHTLRISETEWVTEEKEVKPTQEILQHYVV